MKTQPIRRFGTTFFGLVLATCLTATADDQYWNPTTTAKQAGSNDWDVAVNAWAPTTAGTTSPEPWVNGNDAWFNLNWGANDVTVNGVSARSLYFQDGTCIFWPGTGPLTLEGPVTNRNNLLTFNNDICLSADQDWHVTRQTTVNGSITGPCTLKKTGGGSPALVLTSTNNAFAGLCVESGNVNAYFGGDVLGGAASTITMGSPEQDLVAKLSLNPRTDQAETTWSVGPVVANGLGEIAFVSDGTKLNVVPFGALSRENNGVLALRQSAGAFDVRQNVTFSNGADMTANGMLPPWLATSASGDFLAYDGLVKTASYKTTAPDTWTAADVVHNTVAQTLEADAAVHALRVSSADLTIPAGLALTNASGGLILIGSAIRGDGLLTVGTNELIVYATSSSAIDSEIAAHGLTLWGGGTLSVTNATWSGDTWIHQGALKFDFADDVVLDTRRFNGLGELSKDGSGDLSLTSSTGRIGKLTLAGAGGTALLGTRLQTLASMTIAAPLILSNSCLGSKGVVTTGAGNDNTPIQIVGTGVPGQATMLDCGDSGALIGQDGGSGNSLLVDGKGVAGGAVVTGISNSGNVGFAVGRGNGSCNNRVVIANGGEIWDYEVDTNRNNGIGVGAGSNGNRLEILGGEGFVSTFYKAHPHSVGAGSATNNVIIIDGKGAPGSAVMQVGNGRSLNIGSGGGYGNYACVTNGGHFIKGSIIVGVDGSGNRLDVVGAGSEIVGNGGDSTFSLGTGIASSNVVYVADGGEIRNINKWGTCIGGAGNTTAGTAIGNRMIIATGGAFRTSNDISIGRNKGVGSSAIDNGVLVTGSGALWDCGRKTLNIGVEQNGSVARGNSLVVENGGVVLGERVTVGAMSDAVAGGSSTGNRLTITSGGRVQLVDKATCGSISDTAFSSGNRIAVTQGGVLNANTLVVGAPDDNTIAATDGGVFQFSSPTPTITSLTPGDIAIDGGVIAFRDILSARVHANVGGTQLTNMLWSGSNAFRLNNASTTTWAGNTYVFDPAFGSTNYFRLEMVDGTTAYRGMDGDTLTIGRSVGGGGEMLCSNTTASVDMPFVLNGDLALFNSTLTLQQAAEVNGDVFIDLDNLPESGAVIIAQDDLALGDAATLHLSGRLVDGQVLIACEGDLAGRFNATGLGNAYTLAYGAEGPGTVSIMHNPTVFTVR
ncbi:MAG: beta strand repeat-containing protein [Kiritimatiellia bacterium]|jgi:hypothetical protein